MNTQNTNSTDSTSSTAMQVLKSHLALMEEVGAKIAPLQNKLASITQAEEKVEQAKASVEAISAKRQSLLGRAYLGESIDMADVESELKKSLGHLAQLSTDTEGASAAKGIMEGQLKELMIRANTLFLQVKALQYAAMRERITPMAEKYKDLTVQVKEAYLELIGSAQAVDDFGASPSEGRPPLAYTFNAELSFNSMSIPEFNGFKAYWLLSGQQVPYKAKFMQAISDEGIL